MAIYEYKGLTRQGKTVRGTVDADNQRTARTKLKKDGIFIQSLKDKQKKKKKGKKSGVQKVSKVSVEDMAMFTRQLATLIKANIPLVECLNAVGEQIENTTLKEVTADLRDSVNEGIALNKAMRRYPSVFNNIFISMTEAGEASGTLDVILIRLAEFTEKQNALRTKVKSAMTYPVIMVVFTIVILIVLMVYVIPKITAIFEDVPDLTLPWYSKMVIDASDFMVEYYGVILGSIFGSYILFNRWKGTEAGSAQFDAISLKLPVIGKIVRMVAVSRFTKTLSTLLNGGVPMLQSMDIVKNVISNAVLEKAVIAARDNISEGESIAGPLKRSGEFPPIVLHMVAIGEKTGELENMLEQISDAYDFQVENSIDGMTSLIEPVMIVFMGLIVAIIVFAIMIPIFELSNVQG
ncbi:MAG: type II secretion system inner membrane protein GspF [Bdellovibrionales bacterium]